MNNTISVLPGIANIQAVYERLLNGRRADFVCLSTLYETVIGDWYDQEFAPQLFASQVKTREVVADTENNRTYGKGKNGVKNQVRYLADTAETDLLIGDDFAAIVSFNPGSPQVIVFNDQSVVASARVWFDAIWASSAR